MEYELIIRWTRKVWHGELGVTMVTTRDHTGKGGGKWPYIVLCLGVLEYST